MKTVAVIGASDKPERYSNMAMHNSLGVMPCNNTSYIKHFSATNKLQNHPVD